METFKLSINFFFFFFFFNLFYFCSCGDDTITANQSIRDGLTAPQTIASANGRFVLGFFTPGSSTNRYLGIWFGTPQTIIWVANRDKPIADTAGVLKLDSDGNLSLVNASGTVFWSPATTTNGTTSTVAKLEDSGNFAVVQGDDGSILWQSFDYPTDTLLPGMKLGWDFRTGLDRHLTSWRSADDPSPGDFTYKIDLHGVPQAIVLRNNSTPVARGGHWNGLYFTDRPRAMSNNIFSFDFVSNQNEIYSIFEMIDNSSFTRAVLNSTGVLQRYLWKEEANRWDLYWSLPENKCESYGLCGSDGVCNSDLPFCKCLRGFVSKLPQNMDLRDGSDKCVRRTPFECGKGDGFVRVSGVKLPDTTNSTGDKSLNLDQCRDVCLKNCSCVAYALWDIKAGMGCITWAGRLVDIKEFSTGEGQDFYIRLAASELDSARDASRKKRAVIAIAVTTASVGMLLLLLSGWCILKRKKKVTFKVSRAIEGKDFRTSEGGEEVQLPFFDFETVASATGNFRVENKLGEGGFGPVYKGKLEDGREIAVKRSSKKSHQGLDLFMNEVTVLAKLQHRNLVRVLGFCIQGEEKMLIYEYMPNGSLNSLLFDKSKSACLDWQKRIDIVLGIARGVLYLHRDSRLRIIHRDLKAGNILLDQEMNPKISDFGTARIFIGDQTNDNTRIVIGTYGYMSPEYVMDGIFSMKSDVFSFGVLLLEIMSGMKNRGVYQADPPHTLLGYAWKLWNEGNISKLLDETMGLSSPNAEVARCIQIGLLCVQECAEDRPEMSAVVIMLGNDTVALLRPKKPGFFAAPSSSETSSSMSRYESSSAGEITVTILEGR